jgi:hypothetical protein
VRGTTKVIFLDFDGVVVCTPQTWDCTSTGRKVQGLNRDCVARLNQIVERTGAKVVISSMWRLQLPMEYLQGYLHRAGFNYTHDVVGVTPNLGGKPRGSEIAAYLKVHPEVGAYVVLDDNLEPGPTPRARWVHIKHGWFSGGLQDHHIDLAVKVLETERVGRECAICHRNQLESSRQGGLAAYPGPLLESLGHPGGYAHLACLRRAQKRARIAS